MPTTASPPILKRFNPLWLLLAALIPLYLTWTFDHSLWNPDETRDAGIAAEMFRDGNFAVPKLNGETFLEKPPLYYWTCAVVYKVTGRVTAGTTRLPSALFGMLGVLFTFLIGRRLFTERAGFFAACMLATSSQYFRMSHFALMDVCLAAMVTGAIYFHLRGSKLGFALFTVLAFFAKGFLGVVLPGLVVTIDLLSQKKFRELAKTIAVGAIIFAALALPWFWALWKEGGRRYLEIFVIDNHWKRFSSATGDHTEHPWFYYFLTMPADLLPWTPVFIAFIVSFARAPRKFLGNSSLRFSAIWAFSLLLFFTVSSSKRSIYLLPIFPAAMLLSGAWLDELFARRDEDGDRRGEAITCSLFALLGVLIVLGSIFAVPKLDGDKTFVPFCDAVKTNLGERTLVGFDMSEMERGVISFYLEKKFQNVTSVDQLQAAIAGRSKDLLVMASRNRMADVAPVVAANSRLVYEYRPDQKSRSYLLYATNPISKN